MRLSTRRLVLSPRVSIAAPPVSLSSHRAMSSSAAAVPARRARIYTKTGDGGSSSLYNGERRPKDDAYFDALGAVDELNASIGLAREFLRAAGGVALEAQLVEIQSRLLDVGSAIATPPASSTPEQLAKAAFAEGHTGALEAWIDALDETLPPLVNFILPSGGLGASALHVARTVCRRAERHAVTLARDGGVGGTVPIYLNRLSDYLFTAARAAAAATGGVEAVYKKGMPLRERGGAGGVQ